MNYAQNILICLTLALTTFESFAYDRVPWRTARVTLQAQQRPLTDLLREFASSQNLPLSLSENVKGSVSGTFSSIETEKFLNAICEANGLTWFYDGARMNIETTDEVLSRPVSVTHLTPAKLEEALFSVGYASGPQGSENTIKAGHRPGMVLLVGGPRFIEATEVLAKDLDEQEAKSYTERVEVRTFRLKFATASDTTVRTGTTSTLVPGVARSLMELMTNEQGDSVGPLSTGNLETERVRSRPGLRGTGLAAIGGNPLIPNNVSASELRAEAALSRGASSSNSPRQASDPRAPMVVVNSRLNAVIVRDVAARMPLYEELITMLDVPTHTIEITASIVDIDASTSRQFGLEILGGRSGSNTFRLGYDADRGNFDPVDTQGEIPSFLDGANLARGAGLNATALLGSSSLQLLTRLRAMEEIGAAQVVSSPSVLTMENVEAVIRTDEKVYVRVAGNMETDLFDVTTGVQFRVTPTIINEGGANSFRLSIEVTDGSFLDTKVDDIPSTRESAITTQAVVPESKTLLLGGYFVERKSRNGRQVPVLSKIPVLGKLFTSKERNHERTQRFFFITPRLVNTHVEATPGRGKGTPNSLEIQPRLTEDETSSDLNEDLARKMAADSWNSRSPKNRGDGEKNPRSDNGTELILPLPENKLPPSEAPSSPVKAKPKK